MTKQITLDGTTFEGGGQILRLACSLSALTKQPLKITNIRGNRSGGGGLKPQHLTSVQWLSCAAGASTRGLEKKSKELDFFTLAGDDAASLKLRKERWNEMARSIDIGSPGAIGLVLQAILPFVLFSGKAYETGEDIIRIRVRGGTNVSNSPSVDYLQQVLCPMLERIGLPKIEVFIGSRGWSTGRMEMGAVEFAIRPLKPGQSLQAFHLEGRGDVTKIQAIVLGPRAGAQAFRHELATTVGKAFPNTPLEVEFEPSGHEKRLYVLLIAHTSTNLRIGRDQLYQERFSSLDLAIPKIVARACADLKTEIDLGGCVDEYLRDQLIVFQALAKGKSEIFGGRRTDDELIEPSLHARTAAWVVEEMLGVSNDESGSVHGVGWVVGEDWDRKRGKLELARLDDEAQLMQLFEELGLAV